MGSRVWGGLMVVLVLLVVARAAWDLVMDMCEIGVRKVYYSVLCKNN